TMHSLAGLITLMNKEITLMNPLKLAEYDEIIVEKENLPHLFSMDIASENLLLYGQDDLSSKNDIRTWHRLSPCYWAQHNCSLTCSSVVRHEKTIWVRLVDLGEREA
ncbi:hypothetical protein ACJX0J_032430, partial [Zea mays]